MTVSKLDEGHAKTRHLKWYVPILHETGIPYSPELCPQFATREAARDYVRESKALDRLWHARNKAEAARRERADAAWRAVSGSK